MTRQATNQSLTQKITSDIGTAIVAGDYSGGRHFPTEGELCEKLGVSRSVIREAVKILTAKGLLAGRPRQGTWVQDEANWNLLDPDIVAWLLERKFSLSLIRHFTETRRAFEPQAAFLAARYGSEAAIVSIDAALTQMEVAENGFQDPLAADIAFHVAILHASGNPFFQKLDELVRSALTYSIRLTNKFKGVPSANVGDHRAVYDAIREGDSEGAERAMTMLIDEALALIAQAEKSRET